MAAQLHSVPTAKDHLRLLARLRPQGLCRQKGNSEIAPKADKADKLGRNPWGEAAQVLSEKGSAALVLPALSLKQEH